MIREFEKNRNSIQNNAQLLKNLEKNFLFEYNAICETKEENNYLKYFRINERDYFQ